MLLVKTKLKESKIEGIGVIADEFIPAGTVIWKFIPGFDMKYTKKEIDDLPKQAREYLGKYMWLSKKSGKYCFAMDNGKYFNHSKNPNSLSEYSENEDEVITKAVKDIQVGEEITDDYSSFEDGFDEEDI